VIQVVSLREARRSKEKRRKKSCRYAAVGSITTNLKTAELQNIKL